MNARHRCAMRHLIAAALTAATLLPVPALAWGKTGHRIIATLAVPHLSARAQAGVRGILGSETMAEASTWPDEMRSDPSLFWQKTAGPWHYVTVPNGKAYAQAGAPPEGDAVTALRRFATTVRDPRASPADRQLALRFIIHIVGDLHQPLHVGNGSDRGGNDLRVTFDGRSSNLHSVWDSALIDDEQLSFTEMAAWLGARVTPAESRRLMVADPAVWIAESAALRDQIYPAPGETRLGYRYVFENKARMERRLTAAGFRLAAHLNRLLR